MMSPAAVSHEFDVFQRYLIPYESKNVRYCMKKAAQMSQSEGHLRSRFFPVPFVIASIALSFFNSISYFLQIPVTFFLNIIRLAPLRLVTDPILGLIHVARSLLFVSMGTPLTLAGVIFPREIYSCFTPNVIEENGERLIRENEKLLRRIELLEAKVEEDKKLIGAQSVWIHQHSRSFWRNWIPFLKA